MTKQKQLTAAQLEDLKSTVSTLNKWIQDLSEQKSAKVWPQMERLLKECNKALKLLEQS